MKTQSQEILLVIADGDGVAVGIARRFPQRQDCVLLDLNEGSGAAPVVACVK
jgi:hypothetical protein